MFAFAPKSTMVCITSHPNFCLASDLSTLFSLIGEVPSGFPLTRSLVPSKSGVKYREVFRFTIVKQEIQKENSDFQFLDKLPEVPLQRIASFLTPDTTLSYLLVAHPGLAPTLRDSCEWAACGTGRYPGSAHDSLRIMSLASVDAVTELAVQCRSEQEHLLRKLKRLLVSSMLETLKVRNPDFVLGLHVARSVKDVFILVPRRAFTDRLSVFSFEHHHATGAR